MPTQKGVWEEGKTFLNFEVREDGGATKEYIYSPVRNSHLCTFKCVRDILSGKLAEE